MKSSTGTTTVVISVSGGRTSAYMADWCKSHREEVAKHLGVHPDNVKFLFIFANTGLEHDDTLRFMNDVDKHHLNDEVVWLEGVFDPRHGKGVKHRVVTFDTAYRFNQWWDRNHPFHAYIRKHGVPNVKFKACTRELKLRVIRSYLRSLGFKSGTDYWTAIGIRTDETRRVSKHAEADKIFYPLVDIEPTDKEDVLLYWEDFDHDLGIPEHQGNCLTCFKKSFKKQMTLWQEMPHIWDMVKFMESEYGMIGAEFRKEIDPATVPRKYFRESRNSGEIIAMWRELSDDVDASRYIDNTDAGCSEECGVYDYEYDTDDGLV